VDTDTLVAIVYKEHQSSIQATAADEVNRDVRWAVGLAKSRNIKVQTASYRTRPVYQKQHIRGWRVNQSIRLESGDSAELASLLGDLQQRLSIQSLHNTLSPERRKKAEEGLIVEALDAFRSRADLIAQTLERSGYRIVEMNVNTSGSRPPVAMRARAMRSTESSVAVAPPPIEGGTLQVEVQVTGTVELLPARQ
jgi:predicted secreted protein